MTELVYERIPSSVKLWPNSPAALEAIRVAQGVVAAAPQLAVETEHVLHAGMYARTIRVPAGVIGVGTLIKIPTMLVVHGELELLVGDEWVKVAGYGVLAGCAGRKQLFVTRSAVEMTMVFATQAQTVDEAEREFTDEYEQLITRKKQGE